MMNLAYPTVKAYHLGAAQQVARPACHIGYWFLVGNKGI